MTNYYLKENGIITQAASFKFDDNCLVIEEEIINCEGQLMLESEYNAYINTEEYKLEQKQKEIERIKSLTLTKRVFALALQQFGITYMQLKQLIATNEQAQLEWDLCVELQRSNPLLDIMCGELGITPEQLDNIFRIGNGEVIDDNNVN